MSGVGSGMNVRELVNHMHDFIDAGGDPETLVYLECESMGSSYGHELRGWRREDRGLALVGEYWSASDYLGPDRDEEDDDE